VSNEDEHLSQIHTAWTMVRRARGSEEDDPDSDSGGDTAEARRSLLQQYHRPVSRYLRAITRDADAADDLFQQFAVKFMEGGFRRADQDRGRFRDYLKTAIIRMAYDHRRQKAKQIAHSSGNIPKDMLENLAEQQPDEDSLSKQFDQGWREELLRRAWKALEQEERNTGKPYHSVLAYRAANPKEKSGDMAAALTEQLAADPPLTAAGVRKTLERARQRFGVYLLDEVAASLGDASIEAIEEELSDLGLKEYCESALEKRKGN